MQPMQLRVSQPCREAERFLDSGCKLHQGVLQLSSFVSAGKSKLFSEQQLMDCSWGYGLNQACDGGKILVWAQQTLTQCLQITPGKRNLIRHLQHMSSRCRRL